MQNAHRARGRMLARGLASLTLAIGLTGCGGVDPLSIAAGGITTSLLLDKFTEKANNIIGNAAASTSLVATKGARDVELLIGAARVQLHDELATNWDKLGAERIAVLREIDTMLTRVEGQVQGVGRIEDSIVLDIDGVLKRLPLISVSPTLRRVDGATQYFRHQGIYRVTFTSNLRDFATGDVSFSLNGKPVPAEWVNAKPPYETVLTIPSAALTDAFQESSLAYTPVVMSANVPNRSWWQVWRPKERLVAFPVKLELFPKRAVTYRLVEWSSIPSVDKSQVLVQKGTIHNIQGCGNDGCNAYHPACVDVPVGAQPIDAANFQDSYGSHGGWGQVSIRPTQVCAVYWQHSHNVSRNVSFDARYYPASVDKVATPIMLRHLGVTEDDKSSKGALADALEIGETYSADFSQKLATYDLVVRSFTGETFVATPALSPNTKMLKVSQFETQGPVKRMTVTFALPW